MKTSSLYSLFAFFCLSISYGADVECQAFLDLDQDGLNNDQPYPFPDQINAPFFYLVEVTGATLASGQRIAVGADGAGVFSNVSDGVYTCSLNYDQACYLGISPTTPMSENVTITGGIASPSRLEFGVSPSPSNIPVEFFPQATGTFPDGTAGANLFCDVVSQIDIKRCVDGERMEAGLVLNDGITDFDIIWSTGGTGLTEILPQGLHSVVVVDNNSGCVSSNKVRISLTWNPTGFNGPVVVRGAECSTNGTIHVEMPIRVFDEGNPVFEILQDGQAIAHTIDDSSEFRDVTIAFGGLAAGQYEFIYSLAPPMCPVTVELTIPNVLPGEESLSCPDIRSSLFYDWGLDGLNIGNIPYSDNPLDSAPFIYLLEKTNSFVRSGRKLQFDSDGMATFFNVADGVYSLVLGFDAIDNPLFFTTTPIEYDVTVENGVVLNDSFSFGIAVIAACGCFFPVECLPQANGPYPDGTVGVNQYCDLVERIDVNGCCAAEVATTEIYLQPGISNVTVEWSTGGTGLIENLPEGRHHVIIVDQDSGCVSSNEVSVLLREWSHISSIPPAATAGAACSNDGRISITIPQPRNGPSPEDAIIELYQNGIMVPHTRTREFQEVEPSTVGFRFNFDGLSAGVYQVAYKLSPSICPTVVDIEVPEQVPLEVMTIGVAAGATEIMATSSSPSLLLDCALDQIPDWVRVVPGQQANGMTEVSLTSTANPGSEPREAVFIVGDTEVTLIQSGTRPMDLSFVQAKAERGFYELDIMAERGRPCALETASQLNGPWTMHAEQPEVGRTSQRLYLQESDGMTFFRLVWK